MSSRQEAPVREAPVRASKEEKSRGGGWGGSRSEGGDTTAEKEAGCRRDRGKGEGQAKVQAVGGVAAAVIVGPGEREEREREEREGRRQRADARRAAFLAAPLPQQV